jgi:capsular polysaccharide export protein
MTDAVHPTVTVMTLWVLGMPMQYRDMLKSVIANADVNFPSIKLPDDKRFVGISAHLHHRIAESTNPFVFWWRDEVTLPGDQIARLRDAGIPHGTVAPAGLYGPLTPSGQTVASYGLEFRPADGGACPFSKAPEDLDGIVAAYRDGGVTAINWGRKDATTPDELAREGAEAIFVVADDYPTADTAGRFSGYAALLQKTRQDFPDGHIVFITNGEILPAAATPELIEALAAIRRSANVICSAFWSPELTKYCQRVHVRDSLAAFDAFLHGKRGYAQSNPLLAKLLDGEISAAEFLAEHFLKTTVFADPVRNARLEGDIVFDVLAARARLTAAPHLTPDQIWSLDNLESLTDQDEHGASIHGPIGFSNERLEPDDIPRQRRALISPDWLGPDPFEQAAPAANGRVEYAILAKDADLLPDLLAAPARETLCLRQISLGSPDQPDGVATFALQQPELFIALIERHLVAARCERALLVDLDNPAVRLFARACARLGMTRYYAPPVPMSTGGGRGGDAAQEPGVVALPAAPSLCDRALVWSASQKRALLAHGFAEENISRVSLDLVRRSRGAARERQKIVFWLCDDLKLSRTGAILFSQFLDKIIQTAGYLRVDVHFVLGDAFLAGADDSLPTVLQDHANASYELFGKWRPRDYDAIADADLLIGSGPAPLVRAAQCGVAAVDVARFLEQAEFVSEELFESLHQEVIDVLDSLGNDGAEVEPAFPTLVETLAASSAAESGVGCVDRLLAGEPAANLSAISAIPERTWSQQNRYVLKMLGVTRHQPVLDTPVPSELIDADVLLQWGVRGLSKGSQRLLLHRAASSLGIPRLVLEDGFIRSVGIGLSGTPGLSIIVDDMTAFYDATRPSRLETILDGDLVLTDAQIERAERAIASLVSSKISKYNHAPYRRMKPSAPGRKLLVVVDQRAGDMSIELGLATKDSFDAMIDAAMKLSHDHDICIKLHPDRLIGGQPGAIPAETLDRIRNHPSVEIVSDDLNPYSLIDAADKVFVVTSGMGFEALMAGKEVWCFGAPFYAGWGVTRDQIVIPRRRARRSVVEIFHVFYLRLSRYFVPDRGRVCELEELIAYMQQVRPWSLGAPQTSDESPVRFAERPVRFAALDDVRTIWALGIPSRAEKAFRQLFSDKRVNFRGAGQIDFSAVSMSAAPAILHIGDAKAPGVAAFARSNGVPLFRLREGLIRATSYPLGDVLPYSLFIERVGSARREHEPTDLVDCVETTDFDADPQLLSRARALRAILVEAGISEYTLPLPGVTAPYGAKRTERILVIGSREATSESRVALVKRAIANHPGRQIIYRDDPISVGSEGATHGELAYICQVSADPLPLACVFDGVDRVYTDCAVGGWHALCRGIPVATTGAPFYAGWGLTEDLADVSRKRRATLDELFAAAYLIHQRYVDPQSGSALEAEEVAARIEREVQLHVLAAF